jgi:hypothetical protein
MCGPAARWKRKEARDTIALPAKGFALCIPFDEWMSNSIPCGKHRKKDIITYYES